MVPIIALVLLGGIDLSRGYAIQVAVQNAARNAAEAAIVGTASTDSAIAAFARTEIAGAPAVDPTNATVIVSRKDVAGTCFAEVRVWFTFQTLVAWPGIPTSARIDRTTKIRDFRASVLGDPDDSEDSQDSLAQGGSGRTNASNPTDCDDSGGSATNSGSQDLSQATATEPTNTNDSID